jgi:hypothetical protein
MSLKDFGKALVDAYIEWAEYNSSHATVACLLDLRLIDEVLEELDSVSGLGMTFNRLYHSSLTAAAHSAEHCADEWTMDFGTLCSELCAGDLPIEIEVAAIRAAKEYFPAVLHYAASNTEDEDADNTTGLSLYCPSEDSDDGYLGLLIARTSWANLSFLMRTEIDAQTQGPGPQLAVGDSPDDDDGLPDFATLTWNPDDDWNYTSYMVHVFRVEPNGHVPCQTVLSSGPTVVIDDVVGELLISASGMIGDEAYSHRVLQCTLSRLVTVDVTIESQEEACVDDAEVVFFSESNGSLTFECDGSSCVAGFVAPDWADVGDIITMRLVDKDSGAALSELRVLVSGEDMAVTLNTHTTHPETIESEMLLALVATIGMLLAAAVVYVNLLRRR